MRIETPEQNYLNQVFGLDDMDLAQVRSELHRQGLDFMSVSPAEARMLQFLIRGFGIKKVCEIGTLFGYSAMAMAKAIPADGVVVTIEKNPANHAVAQKMLAISSAGKRIVQLNGDALEKLKEAEAHGPFDMAFIDANKGGYVQYLDWAERNVRPGGLIVGDNTFLFGALWGKSRDPDIGPGPIKAMNEFNARLADLKRYNSIIIPTLEGMTVAQKLF
jgi:predicted O-methyltransferase YrrM